jgi:outer membrane protein
VEGFVKNVLFTAVAAVTITLAGAPVSAQSQSQKDAGPDPAHVRELIKQAQQQLQPVEQPAGQRKPFVTPGPRVDLSLQDAVQRAADKNIDIAVARITPRLTDFTIASLDANYRPNLTSTGNSTRTVNLPRVTTQGINDPTTSTTQAWSAGLAQNLFHGGGNYSIAWTNNRLNSEATINLRNPQYQSGLTGTVVQPLLRGFRIDSTRAALQTSRISQQNDEITLQSTSIGTQANTKNAYWDLVYAIQAVEAAQNSLDLAGKLVQDNQARVEIGTLAPIDVVSAQSEAANRRQTLVQAQADVRTFELALKRLIVSGTDDPLWTSSLNPVDRPPSTAEPINLEAAVTRALRERTDLQQSKNNLKISDINLRNQVDLTRPQLNLTGAYGLSGLGGPILLNGGAGTIPSGYFDSLRNILQLDAPTWTLGFSFAYPLGQSAQEANVARAKLSIDQSNAQLKALELQIATDVTNAALTVQSSLESVQASGVARELAQKKLEAAQSKFEVGMATNYEVVQAQRDFADAQNVELRSILTYRKALVNFDAVQTVSTSRGVASAVSSAGGTGTTGTGTTGTGTTGTGTTGTGGAGGTGGTGTGGIGGTGGPGGL